MSTAFEFMDDLFGDADWAETDALTYDGETYDIIRTHDNAETDYDAAGDNEVRKMGVEVLASEFTDGLAADRATVTLDGKTWRIDGIRVSASRETYRLNLVEQYDG